VGAQQDVQQRDSETYLTQVSKINQFEDHYQRQKILYCVREFGDIVELFIEEQEPLTVEEILLKLPRSDFQVRKGLKRMVGCGLLKKISFEKLYLFCFDDQFRNLVYQELHGHNSCLSA
jgi:hypothetical protein